MWGVEDTDQGSKAEKQRGESVKKRQRSLERDGSGERQQRTDKMQKKERKRNCQERQGLKKKKKEKKKDTGSCQPQLSFQLTASINCQPCE